MIDNHKKIRVLVVDDSMFMRKAIKRMLSLATDIEVIDTASDGREALVKAAALRPDIITLDVKMTGMDGITALGHIMSDNPIPVLMLSSFTQEGAEVTLKALELGAVDFIDKTRAESTMDITLLANELIAKVRAIAGVDIGKITGGRSDAERPEPAPAPQRTPEKPCVLPSRIDVVAIGASTGGPPALNSLIPLLPLTFSAGMIVVQHMPVGFTRAFAERLNTLSKISVAEAREGDQVMPGLVLVAPAGRHLRLFREKNGYVVHLDHRPADLPHKPSVDVMMDSVAKACGARGLGVLLTGMGNDGAQGMRSIKEAGGMTFAESEETCIVYGMPKCAVEEGVVDKVVPLFNMVSEILRVV